jgi:glycosyltransferase involved in cell wall biosynthesis
LHRPALVYFTLTPNGKAFYRDLLFVAIMKLFRVRRLYHLHGKGISRALSGEVARICYTWAFDGADVIMLSLSLYDDAAQVLKLSQCHFVANGIANPWGMGQMPPKKQNTPLRILFFSNLVVNKGIYVLLEALSLLKERGIPFQATFAGVWESAQVETEFGDIVKKRGLQEMVVLCGPKYGDDKRKTFADADIMAFPTYNDAYPLVVLEAMSHGLPVVSTLEGAIPDMVVEGQTGFLVPPCDVSTLAERLALLLTNDELRARLGKAGRERYKAGFTEDVFMGSLMAVFGKCLSESPAVR